MNVGNTLEAVISSIVWSRKLCYLEIDWETHCIWKVHKPTALSTIYESLATGYWYTPYYVNIDEREFMLWQEKQGRVSGEKMNGWFFHEVARYTLFIVLPSNTYKITMSGTPLVLDVTRIAAFTVLCCAVLRFCVHVKMSVSSDGLNVALHVFPNQKWIPLPSKDTLN